MIIALQRAASTPTELIKQNLYKCIEDLFRIYLDFMAEYYGKRSVDMPPPDEVIQAAQFAGMRLPDEIAMEFDFSTLKHHPMRLKLDVGASSYYSEIASIQTLDNLLQMKLITLPQYLERVPDGHIPARRALINELNGATAQQTMLLPEMMGEAANVEGDVVENGIKPDIPTGGGYSALQRKVNLQDSTAGMI